MRRRAVLGACATGLVAGCVDAASPSGPRNPPGEDEARDPDPTDPEEGPPDFRLGEWDLFEGDDGLLVVESEVINDAPSERSGTVVVEVTIDGEATVGREEVTVPAEETVTVEVTVDVEHERFLKNGDLVLELE